jgi:hypothetical protein
VRLNGPALSDDHGSFLDRLHQITSLYADVLELRWVELLGHGVPPLLAQQHRLFCCFLSHLSLLLQKLRLFRISAPFERVFPSRLIFDNISSLIARPFHLIFLLRALVWHSSALSFGFSALLPLIQFLVNLPHVKYRTAVVIIIIYVLFLSFRLSVVVLLPCKAAPHLSRNKYSFKYKPRQKNSRKSPRNSTLTLRFLRLIVDEHDN